MCNHQQKLSISTKSDTAHNVPDVQLNKNLPDVLPDAVMAFKKLLSFIDDNYSLSEEFLSKYGLKND